jgi:hypothetical protein
MARRPQARTSPSRKQPCSKRSLEGKKYYLYGLWVGGGDFLLSGWASKRRPGREGFFALVIGLQWVGLPKAKVVEQAKKPEASEPAGEPNPPGRKSPWQKNRRVANA